MTQVTRELTFTYRGEDVTFSPDMRVLQRLNNACREGGTTLVSLANSLANKQPDIFTLAYACKILLAAGEREELESDCYAWVSSGGSGKMEEMASFMTALLNTIFPEVDVGKKQEGQPQAPAKKRKAAKLE